MSITRVTAQSFRHRALFDVRQSLARASKLQQQIASGLRVTRPSDDPAAAARILPLRSDLRALSRMTENARSTREALDLAADSLQSVADRMARARELSLQAANGTASSDDRRTLAVEVDQLLQQLVELGNTRIGDRYLFAGTADRSAPFELVTDDGGTRVRYRGDDRSRAIEVAPGVRTDLDLAGTEVFLLRDRGATSFTGATGAAPGAPFDTGVGFDRLEVTFAGLTVPSGITGISGGDPSITTALGELDYTFTAPDQLSIEGGPATTVTGGVQTFPVGAGGDVVSLNVTLPISPATGSITAEGWLSLDDGASRTRVDFTDDRVVVEDSHTGSLLHVHVGDLARIGTEEIEYEGTFDAFTALIEIRDALRNDDGLSDDEVQSRLTALIDDVDDAQQGVLQSLTAVGARSEGMDLLESRVESMRLLQEEQLSRIRDVDMVDALLRFEQENANYQAALQVSARAVQLSLLSFLG